MISLLSGVGVCLFACFVFAVCTLVVPLVCDLPSIYWLFVVGLGAILGIAVGGMVGASANIYLLTERVRIAKWFDRPQFGLRTLLLAILLSAILVWIGWEYWITWGSRVALFWLAIVTGSAAASYPLALVVFKFDPPREH